MWTCSLQAVIRDTTAATTCLLLVFSGGAERTRVSGVRRGDAATFCP